MRQALNIHGDDVVSLLKHLQVDPGAGGIFPDGGIEVELKDKNTGILAVKNCAAHDILEETDQPELQKFVCEVLDGEGYEMTGKEFNPKMTAGPLKMPPRKSKDEIACQWEFKFEQ